MSHVIPLRLFQDLNCDRCYFNVSACCCGGGPFELRAIFLGVGLKLRVGVADPSRETGLPVMVVSTVAVQGRAVVTAVSCRPASVAAVVSLFAKSPRVASCV